MGDLAEELQKALDEGGLSYAVRARAEAKLAELRGGNDGIELRQAGEPAPALEDSVYERIANEARQERMMRVPRSTDEDRLRREYGTGSGKLQTVVQGALRGYTGGLSDPLSATITSGAHALTGGDDGPALTPEARAQAMEMGLDVPPEQSAADVGWNAAREHQKGLQAANPALAMGSEIAGAFIPGSAASRIGKAGMGVAGAVTKSIPRGGLLVRDALGGALGGAAIGGMHAGVERGMGEDVSVGDAMLAGGAVGGVISPILGWFGRAMQRNLRDPNTQLGRDLALAESGGAKTSVPSRMKPSPRMQEIAEEARATPGLSPHELSVQKAVPKLGQELTTLEQETLGGIAAENASAAAKGMTASTAPVVRKGMQMLSDMTHPDGNRLPGMRPRAVSSELKAAADIRVVSTTSEEAHAADPTMTMTVGLARKLGLVSGSSTAADAESVVVLTPKNVDPGRLEMSRRALDEMASPGQYRASRKPAEGLAGATREARADFGPEYQAMMAGQSEKLRGLGNAMEASGLPRNSRNLDLAEVGTQDALSRGVRNFRAEGNRPRDVALEQLAQRNPALKASLDEAAGMGSLARLRGASAGEAADLVRARSGFVPTGFVQGARLRLDPIMGALGGTRAAGYVPGGVGEATRAYRRQR